MKKSINQTVGRLLIRTAIHTEELIETAEHFKVEVPDFVRNSPTMICRTAINVYSGVTNQELTKEVINKLCDFAEKIRSKVIPSGI